MIPWRIQLIKVRGNNRYVIQLKGVKSPGAALVFMNKKVWLPLTESFMEMVPDAQNENFVGFGVEDVTHGICGTIVSEEGDSKNPLWQVHTDKGVFPVPAQAGFILKKDPAARRIVVQLPEGYLDVFLA